MCRERERASSPTAANRLVYTITPEPTRVAVMLYVTATLDVTLHSLCHDRVAVS